MVAKDRQLVRISGLSKWWPRIDTRQLVRIYGVGHIMVFVGWLCDPLGCTLYSVQGGLCTVSVQLVLLLLAICKYWEEEMSLLWQQLNQRVGPRDQIIGNLDPRLKVGVWPNIIKGEEEAGPATAARDVTAGKLLLSQKSYIVRTAFELGIRRAKHWTVFRNIFETWT